MTTLIRYRFDNFSVRPAVREDVPLLHGLIRELAEYENLQDECTVSEDLLAGWVFDKGMAEAIIGVGDGDAVGFSLFHAAYSTYSGVPSLHVSHLYVMPKARGNGYGRQLLGHIARLAVERGYDGMEWACLDWNKPNIALCHSIGALPMDEWTNYRLDGEALQALAQE